VRASPSPTAAHASGGRRGSARHHDHPVLIAAKAEAMSLNVAEPDIEEEEEAEGGGQRQRGGGYAASTAGSAAGVAPYADGCRLPPCSSAAVRVPFSQIPVLPSCVWRPPGASWTMLSVNPSVLVSLPRPLTTETVFLIRMSCNLVTLGVIHFSILCALPYVALFKYYLVLLDIDYFDH
jgi:hypothetical protein